jgi:prepilin-type N-terminal cleavage/methylation domain-containing protein
MRIKGQAGFTLIEIAIVVAMIGILATLAFQHYGIFTMRAKRTEARVVLSSVWTAQRAFYGERARYAKNFNELVFSVNQGSRVDAWTIKAPLYTYHLSAGNEWFICSAEGNIDSDSWSDMLVIMDGDPP